MTILQWLLEKGRSLMLETKIKHVREESDVIRLIIGESELFASLGARYLL